MTNYNRGFFLMLILSCALAFADAKPACKKPVPPTPPPPTTGVTNNNTASSGSNATSSSTASSNQSQGQQQSQTATGGNATAQGGGNGSNNTTVTTEAPKIPVSSAFATAYPTSPCIKGYGAGVQTMAAGVSLSGGKVDENCAALETARSYALIGSKLAACKIITSTKASKKAGVTLADCMNEPTPPPATVLQNVVTSPQVPTVRDVQTIVVPVTVQPVVTVIAPPEYKTSIDVYPPKPAPKKHVVKPIPNGCHYEPSKVVTRKLVCE